MAEAILKITNCMDCPHKSVLHDPDPYDDFCSDDVRVFCKLEKKNITVACRPYKTRDECKVPNWCPLIKKKKQQ